MRRYALPLILAFLLCGLLTACGEEPTPTPTPQHQIAIPDIQKPAGAQTASPATDTPVPPADTTKTPYPAPSFPVPTSAGKTAYPAPLSGQTLLNERCQQCHALSRVTSAKKDANGWKATVERMIQKGAELSPQEATVLIQYLAETYK